MASVSTITERITWRREAPSVRSVASSRVRWAMVMERVLKMTKRAHEQGDAPEGQQGLAEVADELRDPPWSRRRRAEALSHLQRRREQRLDLGASAASTDVPRRRGDGDRVVRRPCAAAPAPSAGRTPPSSRRPASRRRRTCRCRRAVAARPPPAPVTPTVSPTREVLWSTVAASITISRVAAASRRASSSSGMKRGCSGSTPNAEGLAPRRWRRLAVGRRPA